MNRTTRNSSAFTLIELLMVIAIIGILAGILIPTVGAVKKQANIAASKSQLSNYITAIQLFKGEYSYYPFVTGGEDAPPIDLSTQSTLFIETLSGRDASSGAPKTEGGNRRRIGFHSFSESEFYYDGQAVDPTQLADRFGNTQIKVLIDGNGDGFVDPSVSGSEGPAAPDNPIRTDVTAWVEGTEEAPGYGLWD